MGSAVSSRSCFISSSCFLFCFLLPFQVVPDQLVFGDGRVIGRGACSVVNLARHKVKNSFVEAIFGNLFESPYISWPGIPVGACFTTTLV